MSVYKRLGDHVYEIQLVKDKELPKRFGDTEIPSPGDFRIPKIRINENQSTEELLGTLLHEVAHAVAPFLEEDFIAKLEAAQVSVLREYLTFRRRKSS